jgi:hypothetical protein
MIRSVASFCALILLALPALAKEHAKVFVEAGSGFDIYLTAALTQKQVPLDVVAEKSLARYVLAGTLDDDTGGIRMVDVTNQSVVFAWSGERRRDRDMRDTAEACAAKLRSALEKSPDKSAVQRSTRVPKPSLARRTFGWIGKNPALNF